MAPPRISVIIPTYQRRDIVLKTVRSLSHQESGCRFEVIVVVDGSMDGSGEALRGIDVPFPLVVLEQSNQGASIARNQGAAIARGELLLFLDDDMEAHPQLLAEHDRSHREGADAVFGHIPLHPNSPTGILSKGVASWAERRFRRLSAPGAILTLQDLLTGQISLLRKVFQQLGGFDTNFTRGGSFGNEDLDFGHRFLRGGYKAIFNPKAISWQYYAVQPRQYLRQWREVGRADVLFVRKHPDQAEEIFYRARRRMSRYLWRPLVSMPLLATPLAGLMRPLACRLIESGAHGRIATKLFFETRIFEYWRGVREAGDIPRSRPLRVLAYHAITDLEGDSVLGPYCVSPGQFQYQLDVLVRAGYHFVSADEVLRFFDGHGGLPRAPLLLTFDDCYEDLLKVVLPILEKRGVAAVAFAVSSYLGSTNDWDKAKGAAQLQLLDLNGLRTLAERGVEIGAHTRAHRILTRLPVDELMAEVSGSVTDLEAYGLKRPRLFAYPYGEHDQKVRQAVHESGLQTAFTVDSGLIRPGQDPYQLPRIEILRGDVGRKFKKKVILAGRRGFWLETFWFLLPWLR